jgi:signal transduction histidine kinase
MQLDQVCLLLPDRDGALFLASQVPSDSIQQMANTIRLPQGSRLYEHFQLKSEPVDSIELRNIVGGLALSDDEGQLLGSARSWLWVPIVSRNKLLGLFLLGTKHGYEAFDESDLSILQVLTRQASITIQNIQLIAELQQHAIERVQLNQQALRARENERKRISRELHDQIIQALAGVNYHLSDLRHLLGPEQEDKIVKLQSVVRYTLEDIRRICAGLRPPALDTLGLVVAIRSYLREFNDQGVPHAILRVDGDPERRLPEDIELCIFRILQETLTNVRKHAAAQQVAVGLQIGANLVILTVHDDGVGFQVPHHLGHLLNDRHFGLVSLHERLSLVGGVLKISSSPGLGTEICAEIPL